MLCTRLFLNGKTTVFKFLDEYVRHRHVSTGRRTLRFTPVGHHVGRLDRDCDPFCGGSPASVARLPSQDFFSPQMSSGSH